ncbi:class I SAM-dependent methyltransferase [Jeongeupia chitinilytica]|uniref:Methyltransferase type 11 domain-containing protein n=1 Tax=Jeongeupia chitinilytica TaxID=1041641 RepID=A0ABQ3H3H5_9NEIS|nr:methyltransferase domain-containing protein [Jeongeupia chitinilytica]GHD65649.1 hypothetical protein GCM10007350_26430 [Jeongeupia chitinilytica]
MTGPVDCSTSFDHFAAWLATPLGCDVARQERGWYARTAADLFGYKAVQLELPQLDALATNRMSWRTIAGRSAGCALHCAPEQLPFANQSLDLLALPHVLDFCADPHAVLREVERVLVPEGRLLVTGFNPWSLWGLRKWRHRGDAPWSGHFVALPRLKDWLKLLGMETVRGQFLCYGLPVQHERWIARGRLFEQAGDRWWPAAGGIYCLDVVKRVRGMRVIGPAWRGKVVVPKAKPAAAIDQVALIERLRQQAGKDRCK